MSPRGFKIELYQRVDGKWAWRARSLANGQIVATDGGQGYSRKIDAAGMARIVTGESFGAMLTVDAEAEDAGDGVGEDIPEEQK